MHRRARRWTASAIAIRAVTAGRGAAAPLRPLPTSPALLTRSRRRSYTEIDNSKEHPCCQTRASTTTSPCTSTSLSSTNTNISTSRSAFAAKCSATSSERSMGQTDKGCTTQLSPWCYMAPSRQFGLAFTTTGGTQGGCKQVLGGGRPWPQSRGAGKGSSRGGWPRSVIFDRRAYLSRFVLDMETGEVVDQSDDDEPGGPGSPSVPFLEGVELGKTGERRLVSVDRAELYGPSKRFSPDLRYQDVLGLRRDNLSVPSVMVRQSCVVVALPDAKAIVQATRVILFPSGHTDLTQLETMVSGRIKKLFINPTQSFELGVIDLLLEYSTASVARQMRLLTSMIEVALEDLQASANTATVQMLLPVNRALRRFESSMAELHSGIEEILSNDDDMANMQLTLKSEGIPIASHQHEAVEFMFERYRQRVRETQAECSLLRNAVDDFQNLLEIRLDLYRNQLIRLNFHVGIATLGTAVASLGAGIFGMNFQFGPFEQPGAMGPYTTGIVAVGACVWISSLFMFRASRRHLEQINRQTYSGFSRLLNEVSEVDAAVRQLRPEQRASAPHVKESMVRTIKYRHVSDQDVKLVMAVLADKMRPRSPITGHQGKSYSSKEFRDRSRGSFDTP